MGMKFGLTSVTFIKCCSYEELQHSPENLSNLSSPIITSSIRSQVPSLAFSGQSKVETISPPKINFFLVRLTLELICFAVC